MALLTAFAACAGDTDPGPASAGGSAAAGTSGISGGFSAGSAGWSTAGASGGGTGGVGTAGVSGGGAGGGGSSGGSGGGSGGTGGATSIPPTFATIKLVLQGGGAIMPCSAAPCHGVNGMAPPDDPLELPPNDDPQLHANLTSYVSRACNDTRLVTPGDPAQSALLTILRGPCGITPRMPYGCTDQDGNCIPDEYIAAVEQWIAAGAQP